MIWLVSRNATRRTKKTWPAASAGLAQWPLRVASHFSTSSLRTPPPAPSRIAATVLATAAITVFVLLALNQVGNGYGLIVPRLLDTLAGSAIAGLAVWRVLPCWLWYRFGM